MVAATTSPSTTTSIGFLTRDPIGYEGSEWSLYELVRSMPLIALDPSGMVCQEPCKPRTTKKCCEDSLMPGEINADKAWYGRAFCCDGRMVPCVFSRHLPYRNPKAKDLIEDCIFGHEVDHTYDAAPCPAACPAMSEIKYKRGITNDSSHCHIYKSQMACLRRKLWECRRHNIRQPANPCDPKEIERELVRVRDAGKATCAAANLSWPKGGNW